MTRGEPSRRQAPRILASYLLVIAVFAGAILAARVEAAASRDGWGFGIADTSDPSVFDGAAFRALGTRVVRLQIPWDAVDAPSADGRNWMVLTQQRIAAARAAGVSSILVTFTQRAGSLPSGVPYYPSDAATWIGKVGQIVDAFSADVDMWGVANEPNHGGPGWVAPCQLAGFYWALFAKLASLGWADQLVSPEWIDDPGFENYIEQYYSQCGGNFGHVIGWHPYGEVKDPSKQNTARLLALDIANMETLPVMVTEVGSLVYNPATGARLTEAQQEQQVRWIVDTLANKPRISRVYYYHERQPSDPFAWDSGLERSSGPGCPRPAWYTYCSAIHNAPCGDVACEAPPVPPDGTFVRTLPDGSTYRIAGGTPVHLYTCAPQGNYPGCGTVYNVPYYMLSQWSAQQPFPREGTFLWHPNGAVFRVAGGALVYISTCAPQGYYPGCSNLIALDGMAMNDLIAAARPVPANGALVRAPDGSVYRMECGDLAYVSNCADVGGCAGLVDLDGNAINQLAAAAGCDDGKPCTADRCENLVQCAHPLAAQCLAPILALLQDGDCGDRGIDPGEQCDDGNTTGGDCCSATCQLEPAGSPCGGGCDARHCDGGGVCEP